MIQWQPHKRFADEDDQSFPPPFSKEEEEEDDENFPADSLTSSESGKKRCVALSQLVGSKIAKRDRKKSVNLKCKQIKTEEGGSFKKRSSTSAGKDNSAERWSMERYKVAERNMLEVMREEGAAIDKPISRPVLRSAARKYIGDTGLLDHLLKHIDGKVAPGGQQRFRRCYNTEGIMEYWLENADLVDIKRASGVPTPNWVPPSWSKSPNSFSDSHPGELAHLKDEMFKMKRDIEELISQNCSRDGDQSQEMNRELMKWKVSTDRSLKEISSSLSTIQETCRELMTWKCKAEQQLADISNSVNSIIGGSNNCVTMAPTSEKWEDWLEYSHLEPINGDDLSSFLDYPDPVNDSVQKVCSNSVRDEMGKMKRRVEEEQAKLTPDSSVTVNSKSEHNDVFVQAMVMDLMKWKGKVEQQIKDITTCVRSLQTKPRA